MNRSFTLAIGLALFLVPPPHSESQSFHHLGLSGRKVHALASWMDKVYAGTDNGVYVLSRTSVNDTTWKAVGLQGRVVTAVYPHETGPVAGYTVTAGLQRGPAERDSILVYCTYNADTAWVPTDDGIDRTEISAIRSIDGFPSPLICGETFAGGDGKVYVRFLTGGWLKTLDIGIGATNVVRADQRTSSVWTGGETAVFAPYIARSASKGATWDFSYPNLGGDNACNSLILDPADTNTVFAGMEGNVIRSTDGGKTWASIGLDGTPFYFYGLGMDPFVRVLYAAGSTATNEPGFYHSLLLEGDWIEIVLPLPMAGIRCLEVVSAMIPEVFTVLLGTMGTGVFAYDPWLDAVRPQPEIPTFVLEQNYPNPFNPTTVVRYQLPVASDVRLGVYDLLGREVTILVNRPQAPGKHEVRFDATELAGGVYFYRLHARQTSGGQAGGVTVTRRMMLLR